MTRDEAEIIAQQVFDAQWKGRTEVRIVPESTIEKEYGWIFFSKPIKPLGGHWVLLGNLPVVVTKTGETVRIPHQFGFEKMIRRYEAGLPFLHKKRPGNS